MQDNPRKYDKICIQANIFDRLCENVECFSDSELSQPLIQLNHPLNQLSQPLNQFYQHFDST